MTQQEKNEYIAALAKLADIDVIRAMLAAEKAGDGQRTHLAGCELQLRDDLEFRR